MSTTTTTPTPAQAPPDQGQSKEIEIKVVSKITPGMLGNPKKAAGLDEIGQSIHIGHVAGFVRGVKSKEINGQIFWPLVGAFQAIDKDGGIYRSGLLYLPTGIMEAVQSAAERLEDGREIRFDLELRAVRASNLAGYSWQAVYRQDAALAPDPLDEFLPGAKKGPPQLQAASQEAPASSTSSSPTVTSSTPPEAPQAPSSTPPETPAQGANGQEKPAPGKPRLLSASEAAAIRAKAQASSKTQGAPGKGNGGRK